MFPLCEAESVAVPDLSFTNYHWILPSGIIPNYQMGPLRQWYVWRSGVNFAFRTAAAKNFPLLCTATTELFVKRHTAGVRIPGKPGFFPILYLLCVCCTGFNRRTVLWWHKTGCRFLAGAVGWMITRVQLCALRDIGIVTVKSSWGYNIFFLVDSGTDGGLAAA